MILLLMILKLTGQIIAGFIIGYIIASLIESWMHEHVSDAQRKKVKQWQRYPRLFKYLIRTHYSHHVVHHCKTYKKDYVTQFTSDTEKFKLDNELDLRGKHGEIIKKSHYAIKLHGSGSLVFISPLLPAIILLIFSFHPWFISGAIIALLLPPLLSNYVHPYLHLPHHEKLQRAPTWLRLLLKQKYFRAMARNHFMHHKYMVSNFNLLLGGDIIRKKYRQPNQQDKIEMEKLGIPLY